jgi:hypothetical protein
VSSISVRRALAARLARETANGRLQWGVLQANEAAEYYFANIRGLTCILTWRARYRPELLIRHSVGIETVPDSRALLVLWRRVRASVKLPASTSAQSAAVLAGTLGIIKEEFRQKPEKSTATEGAL